MARHDLSGRWALVTGASSGIGLEFSRQLAEGGCNVLMVSNQPEELAEAARRVAADYGVETRILCIDLALAEAPERVMEAVDALPGDIALLINNAGIFDFKEVSRLSPRRIDLYIDLHIRTVTQLCRLVGERMATAGGGYILNMSSMSCWMPLPGIAMYSATKAYIRAFSRAYSCEMADRGVSVTVACPGGIATDLFGLPPKLQRLGVRVGALATTRRFVAGALRRTLRRRPQFINGPVNRIAIVAVGAMPQSCRHMVKSQILSRYGNK